MVKKCIENLSLKNVAVIFSLRQEYFLQFLYTFDINFLNTNKDPEENLEGILSYKKHVTGKNGKDIWDNNILVCLGNKKIVGTEYNEMSRLCKQAFGEEAGSSIYEHFSGKSLIQQQIIFNIMEQETDDMASDEYLRCDIDYLMKRYYDV